MLAAVFCHNFISKSLSWMHTKTRKSLTSHVRSLLGGQAHLSLSSLGRNLPGQAIVKNKINMCWRFLSNKKVHNLQGAIYKSICTPILSQLNELLIAVDWTGCCSPDIHMLRASLVHDGRSIPIYNEIHSQKDLATEVIHNQFLINLKTIVPEGKRVVIITDAGFKTPWFNEVNQLGWYFVGRVSGTINYRLDTDKKWNPIKELHSLIGRGETRHFGIGRLGQDSKTRIQGLFTAYWGEKKGRKNPKPKYPDVEKRYSKMYAEPWILISNLHKNSSLDVTQNEETVALLIRELYSKRMQIEQNFRDDKSERLGFGWRFSRTKDKNKMSLLILIATIATLILWMIGFAAEKKKIHYRFQANTVRSHRVLSLLYLAKQLIVNGLKCLKIRKLDRIIALFHVEYNENSPFTQFAKGELKK
ncbi:IS4 family transposase [Legionella pneumophila]|uniref:IS4 family transposase n=2 Tax=Legionella pneumophila TaxID=446 RepID=UPI00048B2883|nr:IS4 family transposase [Legionella pneumophila]RYB35489.1 IS4 family transposase [Legionella pneumophila]RYW23868.1 IS4 family transposase [Legionella pneumophila]HAT1868662.1 IS4 family transposase [Legionella pneumophila]HAT1906229.1 IS4 family transposase [Legionella pneumophila]HAT1917299.1 IS4 family transposase [Legionella pneumophila]